MRIWAKEFKDNHLIRDYVFEDKTKDTRTHKVFRGLEEICVALDLARPQWLDVNIKDFKKHSKVRFTQDSFFEEIPFDYLEFHVIEED